jgi:hypothetical protein
VLEITEHLSDEKPPGGHGVVASGGGGTAFNDLLHPKSNEQYEGYSLRPYVELVSSDMLIVSQSCMDSRTRRNGMILNCNRDRPGLWMSGWAWSTADGTTVL